MRLFQYIDPIDTPNWITVSRAKWNTLDIDSHSFHRMICRQNPSTSMDFPRQRTPIICTYVLHFPCLDQHSTVVINIIMSYFMSNRPGNEQSPWAVLFESRPSWSSKCPFAIIHKNLNLSQLFSGQQPLIPRDIYSPSALSSSHEKTFQRFTVSHSPRFLNGFNGTTHE